MYPVEALLQKVYHLLLSYRNRPYLFSGGAAASRYGRSLDP